MASEICLALVQGENMENVLACQRTRSITRMYDEHVEHMYESMEHVLACQRTRIYMEHVLACQRTRYITRMYDEQQRRELYRDKVGVLFSFDR